MAKLKSEANTPEKTIKQFLKYVVGGSLYFWSGYAIFAICYSGSHLWWMWGKALGDIVGWTVNYLAQRYWAFAGTHAHLSEMQHVGRYIFISSIGLLLDYLIIAGLKYIGISPYIGLFISAGFFTGWNYLWYKYWVFAEGKKPI